MNNDELKAKAKEIWVKTLEIHKVAPETRVASSLSCIEVFVTLYYGGILRFNPKEPFWKGRDRFVISKGHGSISMYPILADVGYFPNEELQNVCKEGSFLGGIPDPIIPGYETINGSLGHGIGVAAGMAKGLKALKSDSRVYVIVGDGELNEGSNWEGMMFAAHHELDNLTVIVDYNKVSMLDYSEKIINTSPLDKKFDAFGFEVAQADGHDIEQVQKTFNELKESKNGKPKAFLAHTIKGRGVPTLEGNSLSHVTSVKADDIDKLIGSVK